MSGSVHPGSSPLSPSEEAERAASYCTNGYVVVRSLVPPAFVTLALGLLPAGRTGLVALPLGPALESVYLDRRLVDLACLLLGGPVDCFGFTYVVKAPGPSGVALWHQDGYPWERDLGITSAVTLWLALDPVGPANGGLAVIPGSHSLPAQPLVPSAGGGLFGGGMDPTLIDVSRAVSLDMVPGDVSAHHPQLIHGSPANNSTALRRALVLRYRRPELA